MASTSHLNVPSQAPWKEAFSSHVTGMDSPEFVFSSLTPAPAHSNSPSPYLPRARYCIFRGFWAELPENKHNDAPRNPQAYASELPTFTTDVRMQKVWQAFNSSPGQAEDVEQAQGSGGGGPCEAVWWAKNAMTQWRVRGTAFVVGSDIDSDVESSGVRTVKSELGARMRVLDEVHRDAWSWQTEVTGHFGNISPGMRGSFKNPPPGQPVDQSYDQSLKLGEKVEHLDDEVARHNFRVVVIVPDEVESIDLSDPSTARRQLYKFNAADRSWSHQECWP